MAGDQPDWTSTQFSIPAEHNFFYVETISVTLGSGLSEQVTFIAPADNFVEVAHFYLNAGAVTLGSTGTHSMQIVQDTGSGPNPGVINGASNYDSSIIYQYGYWQTADSVQYPVAGQPQAWYSGHIVVDDVDGLTATYTNATNATQTSTRSYGFLGKQVTYKP